MPGRISIDLVLYRRLPDQNNAVKTLHMSLVPLKLKEVLSIYYPYILVVSISNSNLNFLVFLFKCSSKPPPRAVIPPVAQVITIQYQQWFSIKQTCRVSLSLLIIVYCCVVIYSRFSSCIAFAFLQMLTFLVSGKVKFSHQRTIKFAVSHFTDNLGFFLPNALW